MKQSLKNSLSLLVACIIPCIVIAAPNTTVQQYLGDISVVNNALPTGGVAGQKGRFGYILTTIFQSGGTQSGQLYPDYIPNTALTTAIQLGTGLNGSVNYIPKYTTAGTGMTSSSIQEISGNVGIGTGGTAAYKLNVAGTGAFDTIFSRGAIFQSSDRRLKENIQPLSAGELQNILKLRPVSFTWKSTGMGQIGFIAQEIETVYPKMVRDDGAGYKSVDYVSLVAPIVTAIQELHASLNNLFHLYMDQEARIRSLEERLEKLESSH